MIGVSVSPYTLADADTSAGDAILRREYGGVSAMLDALRDLGVGSVELRSVDAVTDPVAVVKSVVAVLGAGLALTVHSNLYGCEPKEFFSPPRSGIRYAPGRSRAPHRHRTSSWGRIGPAGWGYHRPVSHRFGGVYP